MPHLLHFGKLKENRERNKILFLKLFLCEIILIDAALQHTHTTELETYKILLEICECRRWFHLKPYYFVGLHTRNGVSADTLSTF